MGMRGGRVRRNGKVSGREQNEARDDAVQPQHRIFSECELCGHRSFCDVGANRGSMAGVDAPLLSRSVTSTVLLARMMPALRALQPVNLAEPE